MGELVILVIISLVTVVICYFVFKGSQEDVDDLSKEYSVESLRNRSRNGKIREYRRSEELFNSFLENINERINSASARGKDELIIYIQSIVSYTLFNLTEGQYKEVREYYEELGFKVTEELGVWYDGYFTISWKEGDEE